MNVQDEKFDQAVAFLRDQDVVQGGGSYFEEVACMIEEGHGASDKLASQLGFERYGVQESDGAVPIVLYERLPATS